MSKLSVLIADEQDDAMLLDTLLKVGYEAALLNLKGLDLPAIVKTLQPDIVIMNVYRPTDEVLQAIIDVNAQHAVPVIMFAEDQGVESINKVIKAGVDAYIVDGFEAKRIKTIVDIAIARFNDQQSLKQELEETRSKLEERKLIDQAKALLIKTQGYTEDQAYHAMRKLAMEKSITLGEMAKNVLSMADLLKTGRTK